MIYEKGRVTFEEALRHLIRGAFNFIGRTTRRGYAYGVVSLFFVVVPVLRVIYSTVSNSIVMNILEFVIFILFYILTSRRMFDIGFRLSAIIIFLLVSLYGGILWFVMFFGCLFLPTDTFLIKNTNYSNFRRIYCRKSNEVLASEEINSYEK